MNFQLAAKESLKDILHQLYKNPRENAWAIQDLTRWPEFSKFYYILDNNDISYFLISGHPANRSIPVVILGGQNDSVKKLLDEYLPKPPLVIRDTPEKFLRLVNEKLPDAIVYPEYRMDVDKEHFTPKHKGIAERLDEKDAPALARFHGAPEQAAQGFIGWLKGATIYGIFDGQKLAAIGSTVISLPEVWVLVSIQTLPEYRGRGFGTEITSALTAKALEESQCSSLTVRKDNGPAIHVYKKLGYSVREDRIWVDAEANSAP